MSWSSDLDDDGIPDLAVRAPYDDDGDMRIINDNLIII